MDRRIGTGGLINKNKFLNYFSVLIALPGGGDNSMQRAPLTFKAQINFVSWNWGYLSAVTRRCVAFYAPPPPPPHPHPPTSSSWLLQWNFLIFVNFFSHSLSFSSFGAFLWHLFAVQDSSLLPLITQKQTTSCIISCRPSQKIRSASRPTLSAAVSKQHDGGFLTARADKAHAARDKR